MLDEFYKIYYVIVLNPLVDDFTPFCLFNTDLLPYFQTLQDIQNFPSNIFELGVNANRRLENRISYSDTPVVVVLIYDSYLKFIPKMPFYTIIYDKKIYPDLEKIQKKWLYQPFFIDKNSIDTINETQFFNHFKKSASKLCLKYGVKRKFILDPSVEFDFIYLFVIFKQNLLPSLNFASTPSQIVSNNNELHNKYFKNRKYHEIDVVFTSIPIITVEKYIKEAIKKFSKWGEKELNEIFYQKKYCLNKNNSDAFIIRAAEIDIYNACMFTVFLHYIPQFYQIEPGIQTDIYPEIKKLYLLNNQYFKEQKEIFYTEFLNKVNSYVKKDFLQNLNPNRVNNIKIYSDGPIEFGIDPNYELPILVSANTTKIPMTPGSDFFNFISRLSTTFLSFEDLKNILVIKSFDSDDKIKDVFTNKIKGISKLLNINVIIKEVCNNEEVIQLLNSTDSKFVIFDCHGYQSIDQNSGYLKLRDEDFDIWTCHYRINNIPPIILFSCCLTNVYNNSAFSVANGFLTAGARATLATTTSVKADESALFMAKLIEYLDYYLTIVSKQKETFIFSEFINQILRTLYVSEIINFYKIEDEKEHILEEITDLIIDNDVKWYSTLLCILSKKLNKSILNLKHEILYKLGFSERLKYILLGNADKITIKNF